MKTEHKIVAWSIALGVLICFLDALYDSVFLYERTVWELLITDVPLHEIHVRGLILASFIAFGVAMARLVAQRARVEEALKASEEHYRLLFDAMVNGSALHDIVSDEAGTPVDYRFLEVNPAFEDLTGLKAKDVIGRTVRNVFPDIEPFWVETYGKVAVTGESVRFDRYFPQLDRHYEVTAYCPRKGQFGVTFADITERTKAEQALRESEERYRGLFDGSPDPIFLADPGDGSILDTNPAAERLMACSREELIGLHQSRLHPPRLEREVKALFEEAVKRGGSSGPVETCVLRADGVHVPVEISARTVQIGGRPVLQAVFRDVTARKKAEQDLREAEALLQAAIEQTPAGILIADAPDVRIRMANSAALGIRGETSMPLTDIPVELHPEHWRVFYPDGTPYKPEDLPLSQAVLYGRTSRNVEVIIRRQDGEDRWVLANASPVRDAHGAITAGVVVFPDITDRKRIEDERHRLEEQMRHAQKLESLGVLAGGIAHDFNNLMTGVLGNAELALDELSPVSPARASIESIVTAAKRAADLSRQMLAYSGKGRFVVGALNLNDLINEIAHLLKVSISKKTVLKFNLADPLPAIEADATQIRQVIMNLITNASEAIGERSGVVSLATGVMEFSRSYLEEAWLAEDLSEGEYVYLEVADTGCGMDEKTVERVFDPFYTTKFAGRGLGLAAVLGIMRGHRGAIRVYSERGRGTTFKLLFPSVAGVVASREVETANEKNWRGSGVVLLVDDEETIRTVGKRMLERAGFAVLTAADGAKAVELYRKRADDIVCVLLDLTMPKMDGEEAFRRLRAIRPDVRVLLSSGYNEQEATTHFAGKGLAGFIQKPYQQAQLYKKVREAIES